MAQTIIINGKTYNDVKEMKAPLASDPSKNAVFVDTSDANVKASSMKEGDSGYAGGKKVEGTMPVNGEINGTISKKDDIVNIPEGYTPGGSVAISETEKAKLIPNNIRQGVTVLNVSGTMSPSEGVNAQSKKVKPTKSEQVVRPDSGYTHLSQVTVEPIPAAYITTDDADAGAEHITKDKTAYVNGKKVTGTHTDPQFTLTDGVLSIA